MDALVSTINVRIRQLCHCFINTCLPSFSPDKYPKLLAKVHHSVLTN